MAGLVAPSQVVVAGELDRRFHRLGARGDEEHLVHVTWGHLADHGGCLDGRRVGHAPVGRVGQSTHLLGGRCSQIGSPVANVHAEQAGQAVQPTVAVGVEEVAALAPFEDREVAAMPDALPGEMRNKVATGKVSLCGHSLPMLRFLHSQRKPGGPGPRPAERGR